MSVRDDGPPNQHGRFVETACALGCDEDEAAFNEKLKAIARQKLQTENGSRRERQVADNAE